MYNDQFSGVAYEVVNTYDNAKSYTINYLKLSYCLLQEASSHEEWRVKLWSLLPAPTHSVVYAPFSGYRSLYHLLERASHQGLPVPPFMRGYRNQLITITEFYDQHYLTPSARQIVWNTLFEKKSREIIPLTTQEVKLSTRNMNLSN